MIATEIEAAINQWEEDHGEDFYDYFADDKINDANWAFWLLGKGIGSNDEHLIQYATKIINLLQIKNEFIFMEDKFHIYEEYINDGNDYSEENALKNRKIMAEFLGATEVYNERFTRWFNNYPNVW